MWRAPNFGIVLPHFGPYASGRLVRQAADAADRVGFDSIWARDHLIFRPHEVEPDDPDFIDGFLTLSHAAAVTSRVELGTAATIPLRHPLQLAQIVASLTLLAGRRFHLGMGAGHRDEEFAAVGRWSDLKSRADVIVPETIEICRAAWTGAVSAVTGHFQFEEVDLQPKPEIQPAIWYCGTSPKALRIARAYCDGWAPGRVTFETLKARTTEPLPPGFRLGVIPLTVVDETTKRAMARVPKEKLYSYVDKHRWIPTPEGGARRPEHLAGLLLAGPPDGFRSTIERYLQYGVTDVIFDLRLSFEGLIDAIEAIGAALDGLKDT